MMDAPALPLYNQMAAALRKARESLLFWNMDVSYIDAALGEEPTPIAPFQAELGQQTSQGATP